VGVWWGEGGGAGRRQARWVGDRIRGFGSGAHAGDGKGAGFKRAPVKPGQTRLGQLPQQQLRVELCLAVAQPLVQLPPQQHAARRLLERLCDVDALLARLQHALDGPLLAARVVERGARAHDLGADLGRGRGTLLSQGSLPERARPAAANGQLAEIAAKTAVITAGETARPLTSRMILSALSSGSCSCLRISSRYCLRSGVSVPVPRSTSSAWGGARGVGGGGWGGRGAAVGGSGEEGAGGARSRPEPRARLQPKGRPLQPALSPLPLLRRAAPAAPAP
jgi:hypothetical protein